MIKTPPEGCLNYQTLVLADRLAWELQQHPQVQTTTSLVNAVRQIAGSFEGNPKLNSIQRNQDMLNYAAQQASVNAPELFNTECSLMPVIAFLKDHKAETLDEIVAIAEKFAQENSTEDVSSSSPPAPPGSRPPPISWCAKPTAPCCCTSIWRCSYSV